MFLLLKCDLKCVTDGKGGFYYRDHLPLLGDTNASRLANKSSSEQFINTNNLNSLLKLKSKPNKTESSPLLKEKYQKNVNLLSWTSDSDRPNLNKTQSLSANLNIKEKMEAEADLIQLESDELNNRDAHKANLLNGSHLNVGDRVNIDLEFEIVQTLQLGHGGWCEPMFECLGSTGTIMSVDKENDIEVTYPSGSKWTFNPAVLTKINNGIVHNDNDCDDEQQQLITLNHQLKSPNDDGSESVVVQPSTSRDIKNDLNMKRNNVSRNFAVNDIVQICSDLEQMRMLQRGHGEFATATKKSKSWARFGRSGRWPSPKFPSRPTR